MAVTTQSAATISSGDMGNQDGAASEGIDRLRRGTRPMTLRYKWGGAGK